jgi:ABC-type sugar transport system substrate-binding protein
MGWLSVERLIEACEGKPLPKTIDTSVIVVTTVNLDTYRQDMKKGLGAPGK